MSIEALKEQARRHEQDEEWSEALQVYVEAINRQGDDDQPDLGLYNRAGDLSTRLGDSVGAIEYYEQAVDLYLEAELPNNAIAILKKILRNLPERSEVFLRMGQIRAQQGFLTDARNNFLTYAEQKQQNGDMDEAFRALEEFADVAPGDVEVRLALADQLHAHERSPEALQQLARVYHQYSGRGESEAAAGIEQRIREIDADFVIPEADALGGVGFETNVLSDDSGFDGGFDPDQPVEGAFDEIALDDPTEIAIDDAELSLDSDEFALDGAVETPDEAAEAIESAADEDEAFDFSAAEAALSFDSEEGDFDDVGDESLDFGAAVFDEEGDFDTSDDRGTIAARTSDDAIEDQDDWEVGADIEDAFISFDGGDDAPVEAEAEADATSDADDLSEWDIDVAAEGEAVEASGADEEFDSADDFAIEAASEEAEALEGQAEDTRADAALEDGGWPEPDADWTSTEEPAAFEDGLEESVGDEDEGAFDDALVATEEGTDSGLSFEADEAFADEMSNDLPLLGFDGEDESFDGESPQTEVAAEAELEPATAVALDDESSDLDEVADLGWGVEASEAEASTEEADDLWTEIPAEEADFAAAATADDDEEAADESALEDVVAETDADDSADEMVDDASSEEAAALDDDDEWIGVAAVADDEADEDEDIAAEPALADFEAFSLTELREYVGANAGVGPAWERIGRLTLEEGDQIASTEAFEEAHLAYAQSSDYMSAMRCVRELLFGEPDQIEYHQRLVEYARQADDRTLLVSAYLELADCLTRTGAPAKARAVHGKVLEIDPTNRRAAAALDDGVDASADAGDAQDDEPEAGYVDLGSMVIERGEKTTRWTVEAEEPAGEADFDFQDMLAQFKAKVAENVDVGDVKAHYDLGTAYKEMGLVEEAITEFQAALRADGQNLATYEMLGQCFMDKGQPEVAVRSLTRATEMPFDVEDELLGIYYYLGRAHEELGNHDDAVEYYEKIFALDINFEDVTERLRALR